MSCIVFAGVNHRCCAPLFGDSVAAHGRFAAFFSSEGRSDREAVAFLHYNLAPLSLRRDVGMLGFIHRAVLGVASPLVCSLFPAAFVVDTEARTRLQQRRHPRQLLERCDGSHCDYMKNSVFGLVGVYNRLPTGLVAHETVSSFQRSLTDVAREACRAQKLSWHSVFSPRVFS